MKTESEKIAISKQVAEILETWASRRTSPVEELGLVQMGANNTGVIWLVDDHGACADIAADRRFSTDQSQDDCAGVWFSDADQAVFTKVLARLEDFPSRLEATNWAICEAVIAQHKESGK